LHWSTGQQKIFLGKNKNSCYSQKVGGVLFTTCPKNKNQIKKSQKQGVHSKEGVYMDDSLRALLTEKVRGKTEKAQALLERRYREIVAERISHIKDNSNGDADYGWSLPQEEEIPSIVRMASVVLDRDIGEYGNILCVCVGCGLIYLKGCDKDVRCLQIETLGSSQKEVLRWVMHSLNGVINPPIAKETLFERGLEHLSGGLCFFCDREGNGKRARKDQKQESPFDCFGSCADYCTEANRDVEPCKYRAWCVLPKECLNLEEDLWYTCTMFHPPGDYLACYPTWLLRVKSLPDYRFGVRRIGFYR
jgi:hypothetical protein